MLENVRDVDPKLRLGFSNCALVHTFKFLDSTSRVTWWNNQNAWANRPEPTNPVVRFDGDRFYQLIGGEDERSGGALLYFNLSRPLDIVGAKREYPSPMKFLAEARQRPGAWVDIEKPFAFTFTLRMSSAMESGGKD